MPQLATNAVNGKPAIRFNGSSSYLDVPAFMGGATAGELFVIF